MQARAIVMALPPRSGAGTSVFGRTVETVPVDSLPYARQYWGARRYLPAA